MIGEKRFGVYIIESPSPDDLYEGREPEGVILTKMLSHASHLIRVKHVTAVNLEKLSLALGEGAERFWHDCGRVPFAIHIVGHENNSGIGLTNGTFVSWQSLNQLLLPISQAVGDLLLCLSACESFQGIQMAMNLGALPFSALIGSTDKPLYSETAIAYSTFYHLVSMGHSTLTALESMKVASGNHNFMICKGTEAQSAFFGVHPYNASTTMQPNIVA